MRSLGWDYLEQPFSVLSAAVTSSLATLSVPYTTTSWAGPPGSQLGHAWDITPQQPGVQPLGANAADALGLRVSINIFAADCSSKHHLGVRRLQGEHWRFQLFYQSFRHEFSARIGMADATQLAAYSPMIRSRKEPAASLQPLPAWEQTTRDSPLPSPQLQPHSPAATPHYMGHPPAAASPMSSSVRGGRSPFLPPTKRAAADSPEPPYRPAEPASSSFGRRQAAVVFENMQLARSPGGSRSI